MKRNLIIPCAFLLLSLACTRTEKWSMELHKVVINSTDKALYCEIITDEGSKNAFVNAYDSIDMKFYREHDVELGLLESALTSTVRQDRIIVKEETIFNIVDTSKYKYALEYEPIPQQGNTEKEKIFARHLVKELGEGSTDKNAIIIIKLNVTDSILQIMQKDYGMLDKFKEYYSN